MTTNHVDIKLHNAGKSQERTNCLFTTTDTTDLQTTGLDHIARNNHMIIITEKNLIATFYN